jgi:hypothetical protein
MAAPRPRITVAVQPRMFRDALTRVLRQQFDVIEADAAQPADVAVTSTPVDQDTWHRALIHLPPADGTGGDAEVVTADGARTIAFDSVGDLVEVIRQHAAPVAAA